MEVTLSNGNKALVSQLVDIGADDAFHSGRERFVGKRVLVYGMGIEDDKGFVRAGVALLDYVDEDPNYRPAICLHQARFHPAEATPEEIDAAEKEIIPLWIPIRDILNP